MRVLRFGKKNQERSERDKGGNLRSQSCLRTISPLPSLRLQALLKKFVEALYDAFMLSQRDIDVRSNASMYHVSGHKLHTVLLTIRTLGRGCSAWNHALMY